MAEKPILFAAPMVRAILGGAKTQTRRVAVKTSQPRNVFISDFDAAECKIEIENKISGTRSWKSCPYGHPGDRLWVREAFFDTTPYSNAPLFQGRAHPIAYRADGEVIGCHKWRPSIHMPRTASRILLEITAVRVERLQDISEADAVSEGLTVCHGVDEGGRYAGYHWDQQSEDDTLWPDATVTYRHLWESINGPASWAANPWVWVIEFKRLEQSNA